jgi:hypothetical protein
MCFIPLPSPFSISVKSSADFAFHDLNILSGTHDFDSKELTCEGALGTGLLLIKSGTLEVTYSEKLLEPYSVGLTYVQSSAKSQVYEPIYLCKGGNTELLVPTIDPFQDSPEIVALKRPYCIDGSTKIILSKLHPHSSVQLYFYPLDTVSLARGLCGRLPHKSFRSFVLPTVK